MNWLLILVILIIAGNIAWGVYRGFLRVVYSVVAWVLILVFVTWATPFMSEVLAEHTQIDEHIEENCNDKLHELVQGASKDDGQTGGEPDDAEVPEGTEDTGVGAGLADTALSGLGIKLPEVIQDRLIDTGEITSHLLEQTGVYAEVSGRATNLAMRGLAFVLVLLIALIAFHLVSVALDLVAKLPVIGEVNRLLGALAGLIKGILLVWLAFAFVAMGSATSVGSGLIGFIYESELLVWLYENNLVLTILMMFL